MRPQASEITQLLNAWCQGDQDALERLAPIVETELRRLARAYMRKEVAGHLLEPTALGNQALVRLPHWDTPEGPNRAQFFCRRGEDHAPRSR